MVKQFEKVLHLRVDQSLFNDFNELMDALALRGLHHQKADILRQAIKQYIAVEKKKLNSKK